MTPIGREACPASPRTRSSQANRAAHLVGDLRHSVCLGSTHLVDNTAEEWKALQYIRERCDISSAIDIATGHFEIGAFLALDGAWQKLERWTR